MNKPIIHLYTLTYNEEKILPFFFQHYESVVDKFFIYDNNSTDNTVEICKKRNDTKVIKWDSNKKLNEFKLTEMRNNIWKKSKGKCDFVIMCDADEFLEFPSMSSLFVILKIRKYSVVKPVGYAMVSKKFPVFGRDQISDQVKRGFRAPLMDKCVVFDPNQITEMNFSLGSHYCMPEGVVKVYKPKEEVEYHPKLLHYKTLGVEYALERKNLYRKRVPKSIVKMGISKHYGADDEGFVKAITGQIKKAKSVI